MAEQPPAPAYPDFPPAQPTIERAMRFFELLSDIGLLGAMEAAATPPKKKASRRDWSKATGGAAEGGEAEGGEVQIDMRGVLLASMQDGFLSRLAEIVLDCPPEKAAQAPLGAVSEGLVFFGQGLAALWAQVLGLGVGLASLAPPLN